MLGGRLVGGTLQVRLIVILIFVEPVSRGRFRPRLAYGRRVIVRATPRGRPRRCTSPLAIG